MPLSDMTLIFKEAGFVQLRDDSSGSQVSQVAGMVNRRILDLDGIDLDGGEAISSESIWH
ncbi:hypothetical protein CH63R_05964 [Colletotrichum higginsianum IMI 349063]|uniref:Uncharacterized protein n=1 Tax=Colletotrichum higginsianum (strain IMI 349063) TaxID=759273 RepID=A0A1B7YE21_COLHI|nr:hypothetical protein CH63R_05964 [Colletotrichum higginsianum IMI 349063]OBR10272.1 hypothetical protein CH63R_05964 [Colletotrichum higginsianum IMI 349063]